MFFATLDEYKTRQAQERIDNYADGLEKAFQNRWKDALNKTRRRTQREIATANAVRSYRFLSGLCVDQNMTDDLLEKRSILKIDDTRTIPLRAYKATQTPEGVVVEISPGGASTMMFRHAFGPLVPKLGGNIYKRIGKQSYPIEKLRDLKANKVPGMNEAFKRGTAKAREDLQDAMREAVKDANKLLRKE
jgi:hypothetical protein